MTQLSEYDRRVYELQQGAPAHADILPVSWPDACTILFNEGYITLDTLNSPECTDAIVSQYERVRQAVEKWMGAGLEASDKRNWVVYRAEHLDVYEKKPGQMHLKRRTNNGSGLKMSRHPDTESVRKNNAPNVDDLGAKSGILGLVPLVSPIVPHKPVRNISW